MSAITKGSTVRVYKDPLSCKSVEGVGTVTRRPIATGFVDNDNRPLYDAYIHFPGDSGSYFRTVSEVVS